MCACVPIEILLVARTNIPFSAITRHELFVIKKKKKNETPPRSIGETAPTWRQESITVSDYQHKTHLYLSSSPERKKNPSLTTPLFPDEEKACGGNEEEEEDAESGNGPSLPQSPNSVEGAIGGPKSLDSDFDESSKHYDEPGLDVSLSLCGGGLEHHEHLTDEAFQQGLLGYEDVCADPKIYDNPNLVVKINGESSRLFITNVSALRKFSFASRVSYPFGGKREKERK